MKSRKPEGASKDQFSFELENLYKEIKEPEKVDIGQEREPDLTPYYELFKVSPDASHEELKAAYERLAQSWRPDKFAEHPEWQEKAEEKLNAINKAYETILSARIREIKRYRKSLPLTEIEKDSEPPEALEPDQEEVRGPARFGMKKALLLAAIPVFIAFCYFMISPLLDKPARKPVPEVPPTPIARAVPAAPAEPAVKQEPVVNVEKKPEALPPPPPASVKPEPPPAAREPDGRPAVPLPAAPAAKTAPQAPKVKKEAPKEPAKPGPVSSPASPVAKQASTAGNFSIQVGAVKDREKAEEYLGRIKKDGLTASLAPTTLPGGEKGFRILVGRFSSREDALAFMDKNSLKDKYPGSFIQKVGP